MADCRSTYERARTAAERAGTHTCELASGHEPPHVCPRCGTRWVAEPGQRKNRVIPPATTTPTDTPRTTESEEQA